MKGDTETSPVKVNIDGILSLLRAISLNEDRTFSKGVSARYQSASAFIRVGDPETGVNVPPSS